MDGSFLGRVPPLASVPVCVLQHGAGWPVRLQAACGHGQQLRQARLGVHAGSRLPSTDARLPTHLHARLLVCSPFSAHPPCRRGGYGAASHPDIRVQPRGDPVPTAADAYATIDDSFA